MELDAIRRQVESVPDYHILAAQQEFDSSTNLKLLNPKVIEEELSYKKHIFSKLKFLYLEQETRDKFLRRISEISSVELEEDKHGEWNDIGNIERQTGESKLRLKNLKVEMNDKIDELDQLCDNNIRLYNKYVDRIDKTRELIHNIDTINQEIDHILSEFDDKEFIQEISGSAGGNDDISRILDDSKSLVDHETQELESLQQEISQQQLIYDKKCKQQEHLSNKSQDLKEIIKSYTEVKTNDEEIQQQIDKRLQDKYQNYGKWCKEMNDIIIKLSNIANIKLKLTSKNNFCLMIDNVKRIIYTHDWKVIKVEGFNDEELTNQFIKRINHLSLTEDLFLSALVEFILGEQGV